MGRAQRTHHNIRGLDMMFRKNRGTSGDAGIGGWDSGDGDGGGCGD
jgi:hypothetical protein